jgi:hypothetical protein
MAGPGFRPAGLEDERTAREGQRQRDEDRRQAEGGGDPQRSAERGKNKNARRGPDAQAHEPGATRRVAPEKEGPDR